MDKKKISASSAAGEWRSSWTSPTVRQLAELLHSDPGCLKEIGARAFVHRICGEDQQASWLESKCIEMVDCTNRLMARIETLQGLEQTALVDPAFLQREAGRLIELNPVDADLQALCMLQNQIGGQIRTWRNAAAEEFDLLLRASPQIASAV